MTQEYDTIIERIARAIYEARSFADEGPAWSDLPRLMYTTADTQEDYRKVARAAYAEVLAALSEMIPVLRDAAVQEIVVVGNPPPDSEHQTGSITMGDLAETALRAALRAAPRE